MCSIDNWRRWWSPYFWKSSYWDPNSQIEMDTARLIFPNKKEKHQLSSHKVDIIVNLEQEREFASKILASTYFLGANTLVFLRFIVLTHYISLLSKWSISSLAPIKSVYFLIRILSHLVAVRQNRVLLKYRDVMGQCDKPLDAKVFVPIFYSNPSMQSIQWLLDHGL